MSRSTDKNFRRLEVVRALSAEKILEALADPAGDRALMAALALVRGLEEEARMALERRDLSDRARCWESARMTAAGEAQELLLDWMDRARNPDAAPSRTTAKAKRPVPPQ